MNYDAFSHGQVKSKIWLCEQLEQYLPEIPKVTILGSWYNVLGFMMFTRLPEKYYSITGIDIDNDAINIADKVMNTWVIDNIVSNITEDANTYFYGDTNVVINCSPEHMEGTEWFRNIPKGSLVCIQSSDVTDVNDPWFIKTPSPDIRTFSNRFPLETVYFCDALPIRYNNGWGYDRFMKIGIK